MCRYRIMLPKAFISMLRDRPVEMSAESLSLQIHIFCLEFQVISITGAGFDLETK